MRKEVLRDGHRVYTQTSGSFREVLPGLWLPMEGSVRVETGRTENPGPCTFRIRSITLNQPIPPEEFRIEFPDGLLVMDARGGGTPIRSHWNSDKAGSNEESEGPAPAVPKEEKQGELLVR